MREKTKLKLQELQQVMQELDLWKEIAPSEEAFLSKEPFAVDTMTADEWLQWIFVPRMSALLEGDMPLPTEILITPYVEEALKELDELDRLLAPISDIEEILTSQKS